MPDFISNFPEENNPNIQDWLVLEKFGFEGVYRKIQFNKVGRGGFVSGEITGDFTVNSNVGYRVSGDFFKIIFPDNPSINDSISILTGNIKFVSIDSNGKPIHNQVYPIPESLRTLYFRSLKLYRFNYYNDTIGWITNQFDLLDLRIEPDIKYCSKQPLDRFELITNPISYCDKGSLIRKTITENINYCER